MFWYTGDTPGIPNMGWISSLQKLPEIFLRNIFKIPVSLFFSETELILLHFFKGLKDRSCLKISRETIENEILNVKIKYNYSKQLEIMLTFHTIK